jgi:serine protease
VIDSSSGEPARTGSWKAWLDGYGTSHTDTLSQSVSIPAGCGATLMFYLHVDTDDYPGGAFDTLKVQVNGSTKAIYSNQNAQSGYQVHSFDLAAYAGQTVTIMFTGTEDYSYATNFVIDDTSLNLS